jgi:hypothetical protein
MNNEIASVRLQLLSRDPRDFGSKRFTRHRSSGTQFA